MIINDVNSIMRWQTGGEYQAVEWIESTAGENTQYIQTDYVIDPTKTKLYIKFERTGDMKFGLLSGSNLQYGNSANGLSYYNYYQFRPGYGTTDLGYIGSQYLGFETEYDYPNKYIKNITSGATYNIPSDKTYGQSTRHENVTIFGRKGYYWEDVYTSGLKVYRVKMFDSNVLVRDFVPCYRISDGAIGMYEMCGNIYTPTGTPFHSNAGNGAFAKGPDDSTITLP